jgi:hypothetical protein
MTYGKALRRQIVPGGSRAGATRGLTDADPVWEELQAIALKNSCIHHHHRGSE